MINLSAELHWNLASELTLQTMWDQRKIPPITEQTIALAKRKLLASRKRRLKQIGKWMGVPYYTMTKRSYNGYAPKLLKGNPKIHEDLFGYDFETICSDVRIIYPASWTNQTGKEIIKATHAAGANNYHALLHLRDCKGNEILHQGICIIDSKNPGLLHCISMPVDVILAEAKSKSKSNQSLSFFSKRLTAS